jgi:uncharacterized membrane protein
VRPQTTAYADATLDDGRAERERIDFSPMNPSPFAVLTSLAALVAAAAGGMMYVFSTFVMRGLDRTGPVTAIAAMRGINAVAATSPLFLLGYFGATILALAVGVMAAIRLNQPGSTAILAGAVLGVLGAVITIVFNVPLNDRLDALEPATLSAADAARQWQTYCSTWTAWNHLRTVTSLAAGLLMLFGLRCR